MGDEPQPGLRVAGAEGSGVDRETASRSPAARRVRLLSAILVALLGLAAVAFVVVLAVDRPGTARHVEYTSLIGAVLVTLGAALALNRSGRYRIAASLTVVVAVLAPWASALVDPAVFSGDFVPLTYVVVAVILCGILLSAAVTALVACLQVAGLVVCAVLLAPTDPINWPSLCIMVLMVGALSIVANLMIQMDMDQIVRQNRELEESEAVHREQSVRDHLTGLFNRRYLEETLERELRRAERDGSEVGVIMLDIDRFKELNDEYGHACGDVVLREVGALLRASLRYADIACRYGGDELTLILPRAGREVTATRAETVRREVARLPLACDGAPVPRVTVSAGVSVYPHDGVSGAGVLAAGDEALYRAKREGRDRVCVAAAAGPGPAPVAGPTPR